MQLREVGPDTGHFLTESCSDVPFHICRCRNGDDDCCCCCRVGSRRQNITACTSVIFARCCSGVNCSSTGCCSSTRCCCCCCCGRCSSTWRRWSTGSHPTESLVAQDCVSSGYWLCVMGRKQLSHGIQMGKTNEKPTVNAKNSHQRSMYMHVLVRNNTWAGPSNPRACPLNWSGRPI